MNSIGRVFAGNSRKRPVVPKIAVEGIISDIDGDNVQLRVSYPECVLKVRSLPRPKQQGHMLALGGFRQ